MSNPYVFISHKHADEKIATALAEFVHRASGGRVKVHQSSNSKFEGPRVGKNLNDELKKALAQTGVLLLVFTSEDEDWQYCLWECGIATDPRDEHPTAVIVLQCAEQAPKPYGDHLRVRAREFEDIAGFTKEFLTRDDFFPGSTAAVTENQSESDIKHWARGLYDALDKILPQDETSPTDLTASTFLRIELPGESVQEIRDTAENDRRKVARESIKSKGKIVENSRARSFFGFHVANTTTVGKLLTEWDKGATEEDGGWFESLADQILLGILEKYPDGVPWAPYRTDHGNSVIPYVSRSRSLGRNGPMQFDTFFIPVAPQPVRVSARMITIREAFHKRLEKTPANEIKLTELLDEMESDDRSRVPLLEEGRPCYIIHGSMIDKFVSKTARCGQDVTQLTVEDLLADEGMGKFFQETFVVVAPDTTMTAAKTAMEEVKDCRDVFVTVDGTRTGQVEGWLTNTMF